MALKPTIRTPIFHSKTSKRPRPKSVLNTVPSSSLSPSEISEPRPSQPTAYQKRLGDAHFNLLIMEEVHSRSPSPERQAAIEELKEKVEEAYEYAEGDPADGKWVHLTELLRLPCTKPRYWRWGRERLEEGENDDVDPHYMPEYIPKPMPGLLDPDVAQKIAVWQANVDPDASLENPHIEESSQSSVPRQIPQNERAGPVRSKRKKSLDTPGLGFPVIKQSSLNSISGKNGKPGPKKLPPTRKADLERSNSPPLAERKITDLSEGVNPFLCGSYSFVDPIS